MQKAQDMEEMDYQLEWWVKILLTIIKIQMEKNFYQKICLQSIN